MKIAINQVFEIEGFGKVRFIGTEEQNGEVRCKIRPFAPMSPPYYPDIRDMEKLGYEMETNH